MKLILKLIVTNFNLYLNVSSPCLHSSTIFIWLISFNYDVSIWTHACALGENEKSAHHRYIDAMHIWRVYSHFVRLHKSVAAQYTFIYLLWPHTNVHHHTAHQYTRYTIYDWSSALDSFKKDIYIRTNNISLKTRELLKYFWIGNATCKSYEIYYIVPCVRAILLAYIKFNDCAVRCACLLGNRFMYMRFTTRARAHTNTNTI